MATSPAPGPHSLSLKVLRLSRPSLATQTPLPPTNFGSNLDIPPSASLANPSADPSSTFPLTPILTLPAAFGAAYVGETFACTLCANCENNRDEHISISGVRITADLQTPGEPGGVALELSSAGDADAEGNERGRLEAGATLQKTLRHALKEEGTHVLAVTVSYTETVRAGEGGGASAGRARSFRKLYQFTAQAVLAVRSKVTPVKLQDRDGKGRKWVLEAQVENVGEASVVLESVGLKGREGVEGRKVGGEAGVVLKPLDVEQVMFVLRGSLEGEEVRRLAQLEVGWRGAMGEKGGLTTGWLGGRV